ncbi:MAG TPA: MotA/TolQ/ExbB proton channel family protein [Chitinivibrionales bacterium]|jgi:biopolymer transport protein ExbB/TolQ|nr:MotA/TolQ/ExbB proton channel family protein [Chitinivibrionales bacterium]
MEFVTKLLHAFSPQSDAFLFMWAILVVGVFSVSVIVERFIYLQRKSGRKSESFIRDILQDIQKDDVDSAIRICDKGKRMALAGVIKAGLDEANTGAERIRNAIDEAMLKIIPLLEKRTGYLAVIGNVATLLGLLGTVYGLIMSFAAVGRPGIDAAQKSELLASGIATAMNSTFTGLSVAIVSIMVYAFLKAKTTRIIDELDEYSVRVLNSLIEKSFKTHKYHISASQLKEGVGLHITHNNIKIFTDNKLIKEINI